MYHCVLLLSRSFLALKKRVTYPELRRVQIRQTGTTYVHQAYVSTLVKVLDRYPRRQVTFKRVVIRILQCELNWR